MGDDGEGERDRGELHHLPKAPFSVHARGVQLLDRGRLLDGQYIGLSAFRSLRDISGSLYTFLLIQGWLSVWSSLITIVSVAFFAYEPPNGQAAAVDWTVPAFAVLLPLFGLVWWGFQRREGALRDLADVKTLVLHISLAHRDWLPLGQLPPGHALTVQHTLHLLLESMRSYFLPSRFYSREYPYTRVKAGMMQVAQHRAKQMRRLTAAFRQLTRCTEALRRVGLGDAQAAQLAAWAQQLHAAVERMANVKEYRTPQGIRALVRCYCTLLLPVFFGPHYARLRSSIHLVYALFLAVVLNLAIIGVLHCAMGLEDPFDNLGLDGIYIDEAVFDIEQAMKTDEDAELVGSGARGGDVALRMPPPPGPPKPFPPPNPTLTADERRGGGALASAERRYDARSAEGTGLRGSGGSGGAGGRLPTVLSTA
ncbi:hypothetical protein WJX81_001504 [Elliptochloris bilobata]|uniref:Uncharacterized protein n=1 Tax=Elliptochloris bilobata TaxID=381761 RepID=A0AAW1SIL2_9CHLO